MSDAPPKRRQKHTDCGRDVSSLTHTMMHDATQTHHDANSPDSTATTMAAPWMGGLEYMGLMTAHSWDCTRLAESGLF